MKIDKQMATYIAVSLNKRQFVIHYLIKIVKRIRRFRIRENM